MTLRELIGATPNMGVFEISVIWLALPDSIKSMVPRPLRESLDKLMGLVAAYKTAVSVYLGLKKALQIATQAAAKAPAPPVQAALAAAEVAEKAGEVSMNEAGRALTTAFSPIAAALDKEMPKEIE